MFSDNRSLYLPLAGLFIAGVFGLIAEAPLLTLWTACLSLFWVIIWAMGATIKDRRRQEAQERTGGMTQQR